MISIRDNLKWLAVLAIAAWAAYLSSSNTHLRSQLSIASHNAELAIGQLDAASQTIKRQHADLETLLAMQNTNARAMAELARQQAQSSRQAEQRQTRLETLSHAPAVKDWAATRIPDPVARLLDFHATPADSAASAPAAADELPAPDPVPAAAGQPVNQPPAGRQPDPPPAGAGNVRASSASPDSLPAEGEPA